MGTIFVESRILKLRNQQTKIEVWTSTDDLFSDDGFVTASWNLGGREYQACIPVDTFNETWLTFFYSAIQNEEFLEQFELKDTFH